MTRYKVSRYGSRRKVIARVRAESVRRYNTAKAKLERLHAQRARMK